MKAALVAAAVLIAWAAVVNLGITTILSQVTP